MRTFSVLVPFVVLIRELPAQLLVSLPVLLLALSTAVQSHKTLAALLVSILVTALCTGHGG